MATSTSAVTARRSAIDLLCTSASTYLSDDDARRIRDEIRHGVDWASFIRLALRHGVVPLCCRSLQHYCPDGPPPEVLAHLRHATQRLAQYELLLLKEVCIVLRMFAEHHLPALPFKGPILGLIAYGDHALRGSGDLDILIHECDIQRARALLESHGYLPANTRTRSEPQAAAIREHYHHETFVHPQSKTMLELHWQLAEYPLARELTIASLWDRRREFTLGGRTIAVPSPEDLLLALCIHGGKHGWFMLKWVCDVAELVRACPDLQWLVVQERAQRQGHLRVLLLGLLLSRDLLHAPVPENVVERARANRVVVSLAAEVHARLGRGEGPMPNLLELLLFQVRSKERWTDRARLYVQRLVTPAGADWQTAALPPTFSFLYWVIRPFRLLKRYGRQCLRQIFKETA